MFIEDWTQTWKPDNLMNLRHPMKLWTLSYWKDLESQSRVSVTFVKKFNAKFELLINYYSKDLASQSRVSVKFVNKFNIKWKLLTIYY